MISPRNPAKTSMTISELAKTTAVPASTVRFYERRGLLRPDARTHSNYRLYSPRAAEQLKFIRAAQASGFSLNDIHEMIKLTHTDAPPCDEVAALIARRLEDVKQRLRELKRIDRELSVALKSCCKGTPDWCKEVAKLKRRQSCDGKQEIARRATP